MDINANLREQLEMAQFIVSDPGGEEPHPTHDMDYARDRLAELVLAQNEWFKNYGFLPKDWENTSPLKARLERAKRALLIISAINMESVLSEDTHGLLESCVNYATQALKDIEEKE